ncbi:VPLPA-CTERM sorting domain-containing protein [uncultured Roseobacter sp.]|uniref:VPLPA-CTERM sorting domain-containing protein n=1 Tax=uncultured Roseobacter sp. TaxID=114847 RepID=UPI00261FCD34|nr:VPLPA-CTERM sorting domain-containing protein [uncultured Roseobacter sp.]
MNNLLKATFLVTGLMLGSAAQAATVDHEFADFGFFSWSGGNPDVRFSRTPTLDVTVDEESVFTFTATDGYVVGDEFSLVVNGSDVAWDSTETTSRGYFSGSAAIRLSPGTTKIDLRVSTFAPGYTGGGAFWKTTAATPVEPEVVVTPLPAGMPLLIAGLGVLGIMRHRRKA